MGKSGGGNAGHYFLRGFCAAGGERLALHCRTDAGGQQRLGAEAYLVQSLGADRAGEIDSDGSGNPAERLSPTADGRPGGGYLGFAAPLTNPKAPTAIPRVRPPV